jgi:hypothetical protein
MYSRTHEMQTQPQTTIRHQHMILNYNYMARLSLLHNPPDFLTTPLANVISLYVKIAETFIRNLSAPLILEMLELAEKDSVTIFPAPPMP